MDLVEYHTYAYWYNRRLVLVEILGLTTGDSANIRDFRATLRGKIRECEECMEHLHPEKG